MSNQKPLTREQKLKMKQELQEAREEARAARNQRYAAIEDLKKARAERNFNRMQINGTLEQKKQSEANINSIKIQIDDMQKQIDSLIVKKRDRNTPLTEKETLSNQIGDLITKRKALKEDLKRNITDRKYAISSLAYLFGEKKRTTNIVSNIQGAIQDYGSRWSHYSIEADRARDRIKSSRTHVRYNYHTTCDDDDDTYQNTNSNSGHVDDPYGNGVYDGIGDDYA